MILTCNELSKLAEQGVVVNIHKRTVVDLISIGLHLDDHFMTYVEYPREPFTPPVTLKTKTHRVGKSGEYILPPMGKVLACSEERVNMPLDVMGFIQTKGSIARGFLTVHVCDGQIDPGYQGNITFEIVNLSDFYYKLVPGMPVAQLFFYKLASPVPKGYNGRYQNAGMPTGMQPSLKDDK